MCKYKSVIEDIANCPNVIDIYNGGHNDCEKIINFQKKNNIVLGDFKGPEAWNGQLNKSPILVISSNPGIGEEEIIPTTKWEIAKVIDFYQNRFSSNNQWVKNLTGLQKNGTYGKRKVSNWTHTKNRIEYLFDKKVEIGTDYTLLELVHCKSTKEYGVRKAIKECTNRYFKRTMEISAAKVLIVTGIIAIKYFCKNYEIKNNGYGLYGPISIVGIDRIMVFLPHTNFHGKRRAEEYINFNDKKYINSFLKE